MKATRFVLLALLIATPLFAGGLSSKYKQWAASPQAYFMTSDERTEWNAITTDADAEKFIAAFLEKRGPQFVADVDKAVSMADKYMTVGRVKGSQTLRGKVVIMLGPPSGISNEKKIVQGDRRLTASVVASGSFDGNVSAGDMAAAANSAGSGSDSYNEYKITYAAGKVPGQSGDLVVTLQIGNDGTDSIHDKKLSSQLDKLFDSIARDRASQKTAAKLP